MKREDVDTFEKLTAQLNSLHQELSMLTKKSPNEPHRVCRRLPFLRRWSNEQTEDKTELFA
jgi:hypothetical protein